ncbi:DUF5050 domain-containing protein [Halioglobus maricola]|uniref:DUF5050 domain-containing protein n=1 Tax=Halioglobus maricola TaxID=2601894 RepID=A0A5P9NK96_9GAMM|nr:DUF5050 domain-containing protein [Halioglobus maricola]QFU76271.1 DUF5050 domain-containing protein [Halioglobus maricola]
MKKNDPAMIKAPILALIALVMTTGCQISEPPPSTQYSIVYSANGENGREIYLSDAQGESRVRVTNFTGDDGYPAVSPDGKSIAFYGKYDNRKTWSIHSVNTDGSNMQRLTHLDNVWDSAPAWSPDGKTIVFAREYEDSQNGWQEEIFLMDADGSNQRQIQGLEGRAPYFLQDGRILFHSKTGPSQICIADIDGSNIIQLTNNQANDWSPKVSPDGSRVVFLSNRDGNQEIYTMNIDGSNQQRVTYSDDENWGPVWSADGDQLFFNSKTESGMRYVYKMNSDGSSLEKIIDNGSQLASVKHLDERNLKKLIANTAQ